MFCVVRFPPRGLYCAVFLRVRLLIMHCAGGGGSGGSGRGGGGGGGGGGGIAGVLFLCLEPSCSNLCSCVCVSSTIVPSRQISSVNFVNL